MPLSISSATVKPILLPCIIPDDESRKELPGCVTAAFTMAKAGFQGYRRGRDGVVEASKALWHLALKVSVVFEAMMKVLYLFNC